MDIRFSNTLKENSRQRIITDMISEVKSSDSKNSFLIIIVDDNTMRILSSILSMSDLLSNGIFSIEKLEIQRESFPNFKGLYFITPTESSVNFIENDFKNSDKPMYGKAFIFFSHPALESILKLLSNNHNLLRRLKLCKEVNISFNIKDDDLYELSILEGLELFITKNDELKKNIILSDIAERLFTVCTVNNEYPFIQYQKSSFYCTKLAEYVNAKLYKFYKKKKFFNEKRGILLIIDRRIDITAPLLHDYNYECMINDLFNIKENIIELDDKQFKLDDKDRLWKKYKNMHTAEVFNQIHIDYKILTENDVGKFHKENKDLEFYQMSKIVHKIKGFQNEVNQFKLHLNLAEKITEVKFVLI